jgi:hypothetical protein
VNQKYGERKLKRLGWEYDSRSSRWTSPYTLIGYSYDKAIAIESGIRQQQPKDEGAA